MQNQGGGAQSQLPEVHHSGEKRASGTRDGRTLGPEPGQRGKRLGRAGGPGSGQVGQQWRALLKGKRMRENRKAPEAGDREGNEGSALVPKPKLRRQEGTRRKAEHGVFVGDGIDGPGLAWTRNLRPLPLHMSGGTKHRWPGLWPATLPA